ncbi:hypothetical protein [Flagellimonas sp. CMM7]|uniref:hypothetical protein n=1 Tax=Flagellimonas sp. CMM7 TaxID=2654676 RepID=UPI0013D363EC|nr:hypothetical protein [Flagellimonas sp. CMM7]UII80661.1 hypothetical protein LV704_03890 [Flagellimonas sp. CMM7]
MDADLRKRHKYSWLSVAIVLPILLVFIIKDLDFNQHENVSQETNASSSSDIVDTNLTRSKGAYILELNVKSPLKSASSVVYALNMKGEKDSKLGLINGVGSYSFPSKKEIKGIVIQDVLKNQEILKLEF